MRKSTMFILVTMVNFMLFSLLMYHARPVPGRMEALLRPCSDLVRDFRLTDLCLFTEANYTRHLSMADLSTPHQDAPMSLEHFPSGALVEPPTHLLRQKRD